VRVVVGTVGVRAAAADPPSPSRAAGGGNEILGIVPTVTAAHSQAGKGGAGGNLVYHGGAVLVANKTVAIYWVPVRRRQESATRTFRIRATRR
jgi:hypothetical protein